MYMCSHQVWPCTPDGPSIDPPELECVTTHQVWKCIPIQGRFSDRQTKDRPELKCIGDRTGWAWEGMSPQNLTAAGTLFRCS